MRVLFPVPDGPETTKRGPALFDILDLLPHLLDLHLDLDRPLADEEIVRLARYRVRFPHHFLDDKIELPADLVLRLEGVAEMLRRALSAWRSPPLCRVFPYRSPFPAGPSPRPPTVRLISRILLAQRILVVLDGLGPASLRSVPRFPVSVESLSSRSSLIRPPSLSRSSFSFVRSVSKQEKKVSSGSGLLLVDQDILEGHKVVDRECPL